MLHLDALLDFLRLQNSSHSRVTNLFDRLRQFDLRVNNPMTMLEKWRECTNADVAILVYRSPEHSSTMPKKPAWIVCAASEQGNAKWGTTDDHRMLF